MANSVQKYFVWNFLLKTCMSLRPLCLLWYHLPWVADNFIYLSFSSKPGCQDFIFSIRCYSKVLIGYGSFHKELICFYCRQQFGISCTWSALSTYRLYPHKYLWTEVYKPCRYGTSYPESDVFCLNTMRVNG